MKTRLHSSIATSNLLCLFVLGALSLPLRSVAQQADPVITADDITPPLRAAAVAVNHPPRFLTLGDRGPGEGQPVDIYPNPTTGFIQIRSKQILTGSKALVNNEDKETVYYTMLEANNLSLPDMLPPGFYTIQVITPGGKLYTGNVILDK